MRFISSFKPNSFCFSRLLMTTWCFPEPMEKSLHGLMKTENPDFFGHFRKFLSTFRKVLAILCKTRNVLSRHKTNHTKWRHYIHITTKNNIQKKNFCSIQIHEEKRRLFFSIIFISVLCDNTWGHTYFVETRKIVQIKIKSYEHDNPISLITKYL